MNETALRRIGETGRAFLLAFTAVTLATIQFIQHALPSPDIVWVSLEVVLLTMGVLIFIPSVVLTILDRALAATRGERAVLLFRAALFALAALLLLRQLHLYFGPAQSLLSAAGPLALFAYAAVASLIARFALRRPRDAYQVGLYLSLVALVLLLFVPVTMAPKLGTPHSAHATAVPSAGSDKPPVFVFVFDEMSYEMLQDGDDLDSARYPNLAGLRQDSAWLTEATSNYLHTSYTVPGFIEAAARLSGEYDVRVYDQYAYVESFAWDECGVVYTCRGAAAFGEDHKLSLVGTIARRAAFQAAPSAMEPVVGDLLGWVDGGLDAPDPSVDHLGMHTFTNHQFDTFLADVDAASTVGRFHFVHLLLPHEPYIYGPGGGVTVSSANTNFEISGDVEAVNERYLLQAEYLDEVLGRFVERLKDEGLYDQSTIVITGDHGIRRHPVNDNDAVSEAGVPIDDDTTRVPFLVKAPGIAPAVLDVDYQHVDFEATLRDVLGAPEINTDGVSAFDATRPHRQRVFYVDQKNDRYWKYVRDDASGEWNLDAYVVGQMPEAPETFASAVD